MSWLHFSVMHTDDPNADKIAAIINDRLMKSGYHPKSSSEHFPFISAAAESNAVHIYFSLENEADYPANLRMMRAMVKEVVDQVNQGVQQ